MKKLSKVSLLGSRSSATTLWCINYEDLCITKKVIFSTIVTPDNKENSNWVLRQKWIYKKSYVMFGEIQIEATTL